MARRQHRPHGPSLLNKPLSMDEVPLHRNVECGVYNLCLEVAVRRKWPSFTCQPCSLWGRRPDGRQRHAPATVLPLPIAGQR